MTVPVDCRRIRLAFRFFAESPSNTVKIRFGYSFTQKTDKGETKQVMRQTYNKEFKVKS